MIDDILKTLFEFKPIKIILFGSMAQQKAKQDSDIDLYVVVDQPEPKSYEEYLQLRLKIAKKLQPFQKYRPIDVIIHTPKMHQEFMKQRGNFAKEVQKGKVLWSL